MMMKNLCKYFRRKYKFCHYKHENMGLETAECKLKYIKI